MLISWIQYLPALARKVTKIALLLPVADKGAMAVLASVLVECGVNHLQLSVTAVVEFKLYIRL